MTETKGYFDNLVDLSYQNIQNPAQSIRETLNNIKMDPEFIAEYKHYLKDYSGRENTTLLWKVWTEHLGGAKIYLKHEDLNHLGSHKLNNVLGQILLAKRMGKRAYC